MKYIDGAVWMRTWREVGPRQEAIRRSEIRQTDSVREIAAFGDVFTLALKLNPPQPTSGLVEQQRLFAGLRDDRAD